MSSTQFLNFSVHCLRDPYAIRKMQMRLIQQENGTWFPLPCNGCEELNGAAECVKCTAAITLMFYKNPFLDTSKPITPILPEEK